MHYFPECNPYIWQNVKLESCHTAIIKHENVIMTEKKCEHVLVQKKCKDTNKIA